MKLSEFREHPIYKYYIEKVVCNCLLYDLEKIFTHPIIYKTIINTFNEEEYTISCEDEFSDDFEKIIKSYLNTKMYENIYYVREKNIYYFYVKYHVHKK